MGITMDFSTNEPVIKGSKPGGVVIFLEATTFIETVTGKWELRVYKDTLHSLENVALIKGAIQSEKPTLVRIHSECFTGDLLGSRHCDCGEQMEKSMRMIAEVGSGIFLYMRQEGRGIGLANKIKAYELQRTKGLDTLEANRQLGLPEDARDYRIAVQILADIGVRKVRLLTNNPRKINGIRDYGIEVIEHLPVEVVSNNTNRKYLQDKKDKMGHILNGI